MTALILKKNKFRSKILLVLGTLLSISLSAQDVTQITKGVEVENLKGRTIDFSEVIKNDGGIKIVSFGPLGASHVFRNWAT